MGVLYAIFHTCPALCRLFENSSQALLRARAVWVSTRTESRNTIVVKSTHYGPRRIESATTGMMWKVVALVTTRGEIQYGIRTVLEESGLLDDADPQVVRAALAMAATSLGMMVAGLARSSRQADAVGMVLGFVLAGLGGCCWKRVVWWTSCPRSR